KLAILTVSRAYIVPSAAALSDRCQATRNFPPVQELPSRARVDAPARMPSGSLCGRHSLDNPLLTPSIHSLSFLYHPQCRLGMYLDVDVCTNVVASEQAHALSNNTIISQLMSLVV